MRSLIAFAALALAACGEQQAKAPAAEGEAGGGDVLLGATQNLPDWLLVARQRSCAPEEGCELGEVHFNQRTISRSAEDGTADIWIQVRHGVGQLFEYETETTRTTVRFEVERLHYRFNCANQQFFVVERQILGPGDTVVARDEPEEIWRDPVQGSVTGIVMPIACRGS